jgi:peptidoglycan/xylan/chitin deacetylase (PgdA/CDA1 family)
VEIGSHTLTHPNLASASSNLAQKQINDSKRKLEELTGKPVITFAYPYGSYNQKLIDLVKEASYTAAVSTKGGACQGQENLFYLSRIRAGGFSGANLLQSLEKLSK